MRDLDHARSRSREILVARDLDRARSGSAENCTEREIVVFFMKCLCGGSALHMFFHRFEGPKLHCVCAFELSVFSPHVFSHNGVFAFVRVCLRILEWI